MSKLLQILEWSDIIKVLGSVISKLLSSEYIQMLSNDNGASMYWQCMIKTFTSLLQIWSSNKGKSSLFCHQGRFRGYDQDDIRIFHTSNYFYNGIWNDYVITF